MNTLALITSFVALTTNINNGAPNNLFHSLHPFQLFLQEITQTTSKSPMQLEIIQKYETKFWNSKKWKVMKEFDVANVIIIGDDNTWSSCPSWKNKRKMKVTNSLDILKVKTKELKQTNWENFEIMAFINA